MRTTTYNPHQEDEFALNHEGLFGTHNSFGYENDQMFDFPEIELSDCDSVAMSLELKDDFLPPEYLSRKTSKKTGQAAECCLYEKDVNIKAISEKNTELDNSFNSCKANFCDDDLSVNKQIISEVETVIGSSKNFLDPVLLRKISSIQKRQEEEAMKMSKKIKKAKAAESNPKKKKRRRKRMKKKLKKLRKVMLKKCSSNILQTFCMEFDDIFKLYPSLMRDKSKSLSNFPQVFNNVDNFCVESVSRGNKSKLNGNGCQSENTLSTMVDEEPSNFSEMKSTLVRSKVNILKGSMLCFEMTSNLREMIEISKCVKWQRRLRYRQELQERGSEEEFFDDDSDDSFDGDNEHISC